MAFRENFNQIISLLELRNAELAKMSGLDSSLISRFRKGERIPTRESNQLNKLLNGIYKLAAAKGKEAELMSLISAESSAQKQSDCLSEWLLPEKVPNIKGASPLPHTSPEQFQYHFSMLMELLAVSNIRLARYLNVDPSLISRYRNGHRIPAYNSERAYQICTYFTNRAASLQKTDLLYASIGFTVENEIRKSERHSDTPVINTLLHSFLFHNYNDTRYRTIDTFLNKLDSMTINTVSSLSSPQEIDLPPNVISEEEDCYEGIIGLRKAVTRFLCSIIKQNVPQELLLYSDQSIDWLSDDPEFTRLWSTLMIMLLAKKHKIKIIHHFKRNSDEMFVGIISWIPLYISGLISPYYMKKNEESSFCHTLFISKGTAAITAGFVKKACSSSLYHYTTENTYINDYALQFDSLLKGCAPLLIVFTHNNIQAYQNHMINMIGTSGEITLLLLSPSLMTIPAELLLRLLERNSITSDTIHRICKYHNHLSENFLRIIENNCITELNALLPEGAPPAEEIPLNLNGFFIDTPIYYSKEEYEQHILAIQKLQTLYPNYRYVPVLRTPFHNTELIVKHGDSVLISKNTTPPVAFIPKHPRLTAALEEYINNLSSDPLPDKHIP